MFRYCCSGVFFSRYVDHRDLHVLTHSFPTRRAAYRALAGIGPGELLVPEKLLAAEPLFELWAEWKAQLTPLPNARFDSENARRRLEALYGVASLVGFAVFGRAEQIGRASCRARVGQYV